jgi:hypothetical protein
VIALFKIAATKYFYMKYNSKININSHIIKLYEKEDNTLLKITRFVLILLNKKVSVSAYEENTNDNLDNLLSSAFQYEKIKEELEISVEDIEGLIPEELEK